MDQLTPSQLRSQDDAKLFETLLKSRTVQKVNEQISKHEADNPYSTRRRLLATSVRLSNTMAPDLHRMADECIAALQMETPLELYAFPSAAYNAMCFKPEDGKLYVMFSSSLLEAFTENELKFVVGHELGHHVYRHHDVPIGYILRGQQRPDPRLALSLFTWSRYAEISADRAGAHCAQDFEAVSRALFKLASGLTGKFIKFNLDDFLKQVDDMSLLDAAPGENAPKEDWFSTHPFSPLRVKALQLFDDSVLADNGKTSTDDLEVGVQRLMSLMEPNYMEGRTKVSESMRRLLFSGALMVANADGNISEEEIAVFEKFFGKGAFSDSLNLDSISADLDARMAQVQDTASNSQCMQVLRDLCIVARADSKDAEVGDEERAVLYRLADGLKVSHSFIEQTLCCDTELD